MRSGSAVVTATLQEDLAGVRVMQAYGREEANPRTSSPSTARYRDANQQTVYAQRLLLPGGRAAVDVGMAMCSATAAGCTSRATSGWARWSRSPATCRTSSTPCSSCRSSTTRSWQRSAALDKIFDVMDVEPRLVDRPGAADLVLDGVRRLRRRPLRLPRRPRGAARPHAARRRRADGGAGRPYGAGKSTIVKLLARFYDPTSGAIRIDGHDLRDVTQSSLRRQIGIVPQEGFLFATTIRENIAYGRPEASDSDVRAAATAVGAAPFIEALPLGYDTPVQERGVRLSIGQRQLVALARALLHDPRLLILDEATSSVDLATEERIEEAIATVLAGRTSFVVAHRLSTIRRADLIVVLENGRVVESGTHDELLDRGGRYRALYGDWLEAASA